MGVSVYGRCFPGYSLGRGIRSIGFINGYFVEMIVYRSRKKLLRIRGRRRRGRAFAGRPKNCRGGDQRPRAQDFE